MVSSSWQYLPFDGYYQAETADGKTVRCNKDEFASIAAECEEAGIELTPERALEEGWPGFYVVKQRGGARPGAGRKVDPEHFDQRSYNAGYQAGKRVGKAEMQVSQQFWTHKKSGETFAIEIVDGKITSCLGPLDMEERAAGPDAIVNWTDGCESAAWAEEHKDDFRRW